MVILQAATTLKEKTAEQAILIQPNDEQRLGLMDESDTMNRSI
jgi:hypothetical protein